MSRQQRNQLARIESILEWCSLDTLLSYLGTRGSLETSTKGYQTNQAALATAILIPVLSSSVFLTVEAGRLFVPGIQYVTLLVAAIVSLVSCSVCCILLFNVVRPRKEVLPHSGARLEDWITQERAQIPIDDSVRASRREAASLCLNLIDLSDSIAASNLVRSKLLRFARIAIAIALVSFSIAWGVWGSVQYGQQREAPTMAQGGSDKQENSNQQQESKNDPPLVPPVTDVDTRTGPGDNPNKKIIRRDE